MNRGNRRRGPTVVPCEALEIRQLPAVALPGVAAEIQSLDRPGPPPKAPHLFIEPTAGPGPILAAIDSARRRIRLGICNLTDPQIGAALIAASRRGVRVEVIVDQGKYDSDQDERILVAALIRGGVSVHLSNAIFPQSYEKELVIDQRRVVIMTMCLEPATFRDTRDYGLVLASPSVIREVTQFFDNDWNHSAPPGVAAPPYDPTPPIKVPGLIWGPVNATNELTTLIQKARHTIDATTELLDDPALESELIAAVQRGVRVRLILPLTPRTGSSNLQGIALLAEYGVQVRVTVGTYPPAGSMPYMQAKTMIVDGRTGYLGSIDLNTEEAGADRELGITFHGVPWMARMRAQFRSDWAASSTLAQVGAAAIAAGSS
jgi:cardiolipin synthase A/B